MKKRGLNQLDWAISLAIFLLYMSWFFIFLKPEIQKSTEFAPLEMIIIDEFRNEVYRSADKYPVFLRSEKVQNNTMVFLNLKTSEQKNVSFGEDIDYFLENNKVLVLRDFNNNTNYIWLLESERNYTHENKRLDINKYNETITTSKNFLATFRNGLLKTLKYKNSLVISDANFKINQRNITATEINYTDYKILSEYKVSTQSMDISTRVIARNSVIWGRVIRNNRDETPDFMMLYKINGFDNFFSDNNHFGNLTGCESYENDFLKLYDDEESLSFILSEDAQIAFCKEGSVLSLNITISINEAKEFFISLGDSDFREEDFSDYEATSGVKTRIEGIDETLLSMNYDDKKIDWQIPFENNFQIIIWNSTLNNLERNTTVFTLGTEPLTTNKVYAKEHRDFIFNEDGSLSEVTVSVKTW